MSGSRPPPGRLPIPAIRWAPGSRTARRGSSRSPVTRLRRYTWRSRRRRWSRRGPRSRFRPRCAPARGSPRTCGRPATSGRAARGHCRRGPPTRGAAFRRDPGRSLVPRVRPVLTVAARPGLIPAELPHLEPIPGLRRGHEEGAARARGQARVGTGRLGLAPGARVRRGVGIRQLADERVPGEVGERRDGGPAHGDEAPRVGAIRPTRAEVRLRGGERARGDRLEEGAARPGVRDQADPRPAGGAVHHGAARRLRVAHDHRPVMVLPPSSETQA